jgi:hypothetical protein
MNVFVVITIDNVEGIFLACKVFKNLVDAEIYAAEETVEDCVALIKEKYVCGS